MQENLKNKFQELINGSINQPYIEYLYNNYVQKKIEISQKIGLQKRQILVYTKSESEYIEKAYKHYFDVILPEFFSILFLNFIFTIHNKNKCREEKIQKKVSYINKLTKYYLYNYQYSNTKYGNYDYKNDTIAIEFLIFMIYYYDFALNMKVMNKDEIKRLHTKLYEIDKNESILLANSYVFNLANDIILNKEMLNNMQFNQLFFLLNLQNLCLFMLGKSINNNSFYFGSFYKVFNEKIDNQKDIVSSLFLNQNKNISIIFGNEYLQNIKSKINSKK
ncbi:MAG: hypothetical protein KatS3mg096_596 [Candidatus Parcubacteria bacterium]|nr:MAG: hypothetical protein KatS3mg096_596 [Candidatus Parcubacteria bacterium]